MLKRGRKPKTDKVNTNLHSSAYKIFEGYDHFNSKPLFKVVAITEDNEYEGEWHDKKSDAESELKSLTTSKYERGALIKGKGSRAKNAYNKEVDLYKWFIVDLSKKTAIAGNEYKEDAIDALSDYDGDKNFKIVSKSQLKKLGIDDPTSEWKYAEGGWLKDHNYVNKKEDYEVRYSKDKKNRTGYKKFEGGGEIEAKISKLQGIIDSTIIQNQSAKDKAKTEIEKLKNQLDEIKESKSEDKSEYEDKEVYIEFLNKEKNFKKDKKYFSKYEDAVEWGKSNLDKFNMDMIIFNDEYKEPKNDLLTETEEKRLDELQKKEDNDNLTKSENLEYEKLVSKYRKQKAIKSESKEDLKHTYSMLDRLKEDNEYFLGNGNREESTLWAGNVKDQIAEMKKLWNELPKDGKPEWLSMAEIEEYEAKMTKSAEPSILKTDKGFIDETKAEIFKDKMVTYYFKSEFGMGISKIEGKLLKIGFEKYAQYNQSFFINLIPKGKRNGLKFRQNYNPFAIVLAGVGHPSPDDYLESVSEDKDVKISKSRHSSFSSEWAKEFNSKINDYLETHKEDIIADVRENREISSKSKEVPFKVSEKFEIESTNSNYKKLKKQFPVISTSEDLGLHMTGGSDDFEHVQKRSKELFNIELKKIDVINNPNGHGKVVLFKISPKDSNPKEVKKVSHKDLLAKAKAKKSKATPSNAPSKGHKRNESSDRKRDALPLGKRISESGNVYYENRLNRGDLDKGDKFKTGGEIMKKGKEISFEKSNLYLVGKGHDTNGNAAVKVKYPNSGTFSIQTLGNLPKTKSILNGVSNLAELTADDLERMEKEIVSYIESFGTPTQKKGLKTYFAKGGEIESNPFKTKRGCW